MKLLDQIFIFIVHFYFLEIFKSAINSENEIMDI